MNCERCGTDEHVRPREEWNEEVNLCPGCLNDLLILWRDTQTLSDLSRKWSVPTYSPDEIKETIRQRRSAKNRTRRLASQLTKY